MGEILGGSAGVQAASKEIEITSQAYKAHGAYPGGCRNVKRGKYALCMGTFCLI
jgi:hypothetical protein